MEGDSNPELSMIADTFKLLGNTGYGKTLTNKENHAEVFYTDYEKAAELSISPYMKRINIQLGENPYVRVLYDILQKYFDPSDYQCMQTDTDSIYLALSAPDLLSIVKPDISDKFLTEEKRCVEFSTAEKLASELNVSLFEVSAKTGINVDEAFTELSRDMRERLMLWRIDQGVAGGRDLDDDDDFESEFSSGFHVDGVVGKKSLITEQWSCCGSSKNGTFV
uniref:Uncharacterized protein n=1 Tax=Romanomermis culicivorax TaxID=13658 RepID=A0A915IX41_ROMCU